MTGDPAFISVLSRLKCECWTAPRESAILAALTPATGRCRLQLEIASLDCRTPMSRPAKSVLSLDRCSCMAFRVFTRNGRKSRELRHSRLRSPQTLARRSVLPSRGRPRSDEQHRLGVE